MDPAAERLAPLLGQLVNYERSRPDRRVWDLATITAVLARPGAGVRPAPAVQVGGSKGKGTTCMFLAGLATAAGLRPGVYLSPHVETLLERIQVGNQLVRIEVLERVLADIVAFARQRGLQVSFFEAMTAAALDVFAGERVGLAIWEVGLGGRYDATTAIPVDASIVTSIELEHTEVLGDTIAAIAAEKAQVIRPGGVGLTATQGEALAVIERHAHSAGARLVVLGRDLAWREMRWQDDGFRGRLQLPDGRVLPVWLPDARNYEVQALALAAAAFALLCPGAPLQLDPAPRPVLPCRFEVHQGADGFPFVLDGAHTETSLAAVAAELQRRWPGRRWAVLFGSAQGKRWRESLRALLPLADRFHVTEVSGTTSEDPSAVAQWLRERQRVAVVEPGAEAGLAALLQHRGPRLVVGSFYLAGRVRGLLREQQGPTGQQ